MNEVNNENEQDISRLAPICGFCQTDPLSVVSNMREIPASPGQPIPIIQIFFCRDCRALLSMQIVGMRQPEIVGAAQVPQQGIGGVQLK
jgi:hypothetical protein